MKNLINEMILKGVFRQAKCLNNAYIVKIKGKRYISKHSNECLNFFTGKNIFVCSIRL